MKVKWVELHDSIGAQNLKCIGCGGYFSSLYYLTEATVERIAVDKEHETAMCDSCASFHADDRPSHLVIVNGELSAMLDYVVLQVLFNVDEKPREYEPDEFPKGEFGNEETRRANTFNPNEPPDLWHQWKRANTDDW